MKKKLSKSISAGIVINIIAVVLVKSVGIFIAPVMTRLLTTEDYGLYSIYNTWSNMIGTIAGLGVVGSLTNFRVKSDRNEYHKYCWNMLWLGAIGHLAVFLVTVLLKESFANILKLPEMLIPIMVISALTSYCVSFLSTYFIIDNMALYNAGISLFAVGGSFGVSVALITICNVTTELYLPFIEGHLIVNLIISFGCLLLFAIKGKSKIRIDYVGYGLNIGIPLVFHALAGCVLGSSDRIMIQQMVGISEAGVYSFTFAFAAILSSLWQAINSIWAPFLFKYLKENDIESIQEKKRNFDFLFTMLTIGFILVYPEVFRLLANERYWGMIKIVPIIGIAFFANHLYSFPTNYETYREKTKYVAMGSIGAAIVNVILNSLLIPLMHETGAAIATAMSYYALFVFHYFISKKIIGEYPFRNIISVKYIIFLIACVCAFYVSYNIWWIRWGVAIIVAYVLMRDVIKRKSIL